MDSETTTLIHAHLDGRLSAAETERLGELIREDAAVAAAFAEASRLNHMLREAVKEDFRASLHARRMGGADGRRLRDGEEEAPPARSPARRLVRQLAIAACLALFLGGMLALLTTGNPGPQAQSSPAGQRPSSLEARAAGARGPFLQPAAPATADALLRKRLRQFVLPDPAVKAQPAQAALAALATQWSTLPQIDETWAKTVTFTIAPDVLDAWKTAGREPKVTLEIPGTSLHANLELLAAQADLKVTMRETGVILTAAEKYDLAKLVEIRGRVELAAVERIQEFLLSTVRQYEIEAEQARETMLKRNRQFGINGGPSDSKIPAAENDSPGEVVQRKQKATYEAAVGRLLRAQAEAGQFGLRPPPTAADTPASLDRLPLEILRKAYPGNLCVNDTVISTHLPEYQGALLRLQELSLSHLGRRHPTLLALERKKEELARLLADHIRSVLRASSEAEAAIASRLVNEYGTPASAPDRIGTGWMRDRLLSTGVVAYCTEVEQAVEWKGDGTRRELRISNALQAAIQDAPKSRLGTVHFLEFPADADLSFAPPGTGPTVAVMNAEQAKAAVGQKGVRAIGFMLETDGAETRVIAENLHRAADGESVEPWTGWELSIRTSPLKGHRVRCLSGLTLRWAVSGQADGGEVGKVVQEDHQTAEFNLLQGHTLCIPAPEKPGDTARRFFFVTIPD